MGGGRRLLELWSGDERLNNQEASLVEHSNIGTLDLTDITVFMNAIA